MGTGEGRPRRKVSDIEVVYAYGSVGRIAGKLLCWS